MGITTEVIRDGNKVQINVCMPATEIFEGMLAPSEAETISFTAYDLHVYGELLWKSEYEHHVGPVDVDINGEKWTLSDSLWRELYLALREVDGVFTAEAIEELENETVH